MKSLPECEEYKLDSKITLHETRSKITFLNPNRNKVLVIRVDGCVIKDNKTRRCDYAMIPGIEVEVYVELKGSKVAEAIAQIESTINLLSADPQKIKKLCFVVSTRVPKQFTTEKQKLKSKFKKRFEAELHIETQELTYDLSKIKRVKS